MSEPCRRRPVLLTDFRVERYPRTMRNIHFTDDEMLSGTPFDFLRIEEAESCDGEVCGARPELALLSASESQAYLSIHKPVGRHYHILGLRNCQGARPHFYYL